MSVYLQKDLSEQARPETSKRSRATSRKQPTQSCMRSTSFNFTRNPFASSPNNYRKHTFEKRRVKLSPQLELRPSSQQQPFRRGMTLQEYMVTEQDPDVQNPDDFGQKQEQLCADWRINFRIEQLNEDQEQEAKQQKSIQNKLHLQHQIQNFPSKAVKKYPPTILPFQNNSIVKNVKRSTVINFYNHKRVNSNIEKYEAREEYLMKKYAQKFRLNEDTGRSKRVDNIIHKINNESLIKMKHKLSKFI